LARLSGLAQLERLYLGNTQVTDAGLDHLKPLVKLKQLDLYGDNVTDFGVKRLEKAIPGLTISR
jgi:hypothetical protein